MTVKGPIDMVTTLHRYLPELVRYINLNQLCPYLVSERLITLAVCKELLQPHQASRQYCRAYSLSRGCNGDHRPCLLS